MQTRCDDIHAVRNDPQIGVKERDRRSTRDSTPAMIDWKFCGKEHLKRKEDCLAWVKRCAKCGDRNHFAIKCKKESSKQGQKLNKCKGKVHFVDDNESDSEDDDYVLQVDSGETNASGCY